MNIINTTIKNKIIEILLQNKVGLGVYTIAKLAKISVSEVWRQIPILVRYGLIIEAVKGISGKRKKYQINSDNPLIEIYRQLLNQYLKINGVIDSTPIEAMKCFLKNYYVTGTYAIKEMSWDICYPDGFTVAVDPTEYSTAELLKNCFINRWNFTIIKKDVRNCDFYYDTLEGINKATSEQAVCDSIAAYELDPNNIEILYFLLVEDLNWKKLARLVRTQWGDLALYRIHYLFSCARILGGQLYPADLFHPKSATQRQDLKFTQDVQTSCFRVLLCNGIAQKQAW